MNKEEEAVRQLVRSVLLEVANRYGWETSNRKNLLLDKEGMEKSDRDKIAAFLKSCGLMK